MAFPVGWSYKAAITIDNTQVTGTLTDFPFLMTIANLPSGMVDSDGSTPALNGGGDVRVSTDAAGTTQIPLDIVDFTTNANPASATVEMYAKVASVSSSVDTTIYVWWGKAAESQPAVGDTYGRNAVWTDYEAVLHLEEDPSGTAPQMVDSTGNSHDGTSAGTMTSGDSIAGPVGNAIDLDGTDDIIDLGSIDVTAASAITWQHWMKVTNTGARMFSLLHSGSDDLRTWVATVPHIGVDDGTAYTAALPSSAVDSTWRLIHGAFGSSTVRAYMDGAENANTGSASFNFGTADGNTNLGRSGADTGAFCPGGIDEFRMRFEELSAAWIAADFTSQDTPGTFASAGSVQSLLGLPAGGLSLLGVGA